MRAGSWANRAPLLDPGCLQYAQYDPTIEVEQTAVIAQQFAFKGRYCVPDFSGYVTGVQIPTVFRSLVVCYCLQLVLLS